ncbi:hypothetical protein O3M35_008885 [Rhynocoris fuscipes]|uniref:Reverse transcriptase n=1 Tax=Rhynocoris fuscipes TaxID=488301 RepID=A0AAW1D8G5_9HEMI
MIIHRLDNPSTNISYTPHHLSRIGIDINPICSCNTQSIADSNHLILDCNRYVDGRDELWRAIRHTSSPLPTNLHTALRHAENDLYLNFYKYIKRNNITI